MKYTWNLEDCFTELSKCKWEKLEQFEENT